MSVLLVATSNDTSVTTSPASPPTLKKPTKDDYYIESNK